MADTKPLTLTLQEGDRVSLGYHSEPDRIERQFRISLIRNGREHVALFDEDTTLVVDGKGKNTLITIAGNVGLAPDDPIPRIQMDAENIVIAGGSFITAKESKRAPLIPYTPDNRLGINYDEESRIIDERYDKNALVLTNIGRENRKVIIERSATAPGIVAVDAFENPKHTYKVEGNKTLEANLQTLPQIKNKPEVPAMAPAEKPKPKEGLTHADQEKIRGALENVETLEQAEKFPPIRRLKDTDKTLDTHWKKLIAAADEAAQKTDPDTVKTFQKQLQETVRYVQEKAETGGAYVTFKSRLEGIERDFNSATRNIPGLGDQGRSAPPQDVLQAARQAVDSSIQNQHAAPADHGFDKVALVNKGKPLTPGTPSLPA